jgi:PAS domain S-box-containing protein
MLASIVQSSHDAIIGQTLDGVVSSWNPGAERLLGYSAGEIIGCPVDMLIPDERQADEMAVLERIVRGDRVEQYDTERLRKDGSVVAVSLTMSPIGEATIAITGAASVSRDITDRRRAETRVRGLLEAAPDAVVGVDSEGRVASLEQLAGGVAHDFNNLLAVILNYAGFVADEVAKARHSPGGEHWDAVCRDVEQIQQAAERATRLTGQLLAFGRHEVVQPRRILLDDVVSAVEQPLRRMLDEDVDLVTSLSADPWPITADPCQIERVLVNLAVNARDAMPHGGVLSISTENLIVDEEYAAQRPGVVRGHFVRLQVSDTGIGMDRDVLARAFEPFFTTKPTGEGSGLGLATVYGIITQAHGQAQIDSEPGFGTTFTALLPATEEAVRHHEAPDVVVMDHHLPDEAGVAAAGEVVISPEHLSRLMLPRSDVPGSTPVLTRRENEVLRVMADGLSNQAIAERLSLSVNTIRNHVQLILDKLGAHSKLEAVVMATRRGLLPRADPAAPRDRPQPPGGTRVGRNGVRAHLPSSPR